MKILELGNYIIPAYAGMVLAEQGHKVEKWTLPGRDPILSLHRGQDLWKWLNHGKVVNDVHLDYLDSYLPHYDCVIDNLTPTALKRFGIEPEFLAEKYRLRWVSMRSEVGERSFDIIAQARSWMEYAPWVPFYIGDTAAGLWLAFKAAASTDTGHSVLGHASCLQKLVEGELMLFPKREKNRTPWDLEQYGPDGEGVAVQYKGTRVAEEIRSSEWKLDNLFHENGRITI